MSLAVIITHALVVIPARMMVSAPIYSSSWADGRRRYAGRLELDRGQGECSTEVIFGGNQRSVDFVQRCRSYEETDCGFFLCSSANVNAGTELRPCPGNSRKQPKDLDQSDSAISCSRPLSEH